MNQQEEKREHIIPTWLLLVLGLGLAGGLFFFSLGGEPEQPQPGDDPEPGLSQKIGGFWDKIQLWAEDSLGLFGVTPEERTIAAQDHSYTLSIPGNWDYYNEDYGDFFSAHGPDDQYNLMLSRSAKADYDEDYTAEILAEWVFSALECQEDCQIERSETENLEINGLPAQKSLQIHRESSGEYYEELLFISGAESYYVLSFFCPAEDWGRLQPVWAGVYTSFQEQPDAGQAFAYGAGDSLEIMAELGLDRMETWQSGPVRLSLFSDWQAEPYEEEGYLLSAWNDYQHKTLELVKDSKDAAGADAAAYLVEYQQQLQEAFGAGQLMEEENLSIHGLSAYKAVYLEEAYMEKQMVQAYVIEGAADYYHLYLSCPASKYPRYAREFEAIAASFAEE